MVPADFSHLDFILRAKILTPGETSSWWIALYYGSVDYRSRSLAGLDHDLVRIEFDSSFRLSRSVTVQVHPRYEQLNSKTRSTTVSELSVETMTSWRFMPLWSGGASVAYEVRNISNDTVGSWRRLIYGLSLLTDL
jgi:hypothetical protein